MRVYRQKYRHGVVIAPRRQEIRFVIPVVVGSSLISHPKELFSIKRLGAAEDYDMSRNSE